MNTPTRASTPAAGLAITLLLAQLAAAQGVNRLDLHPQTLYARPGDPVVFDMDVSDLAQRINACQAMLGYSSTYFADPAGAVVTAGGGVWDLVIWDSWVDNPSPTPGEIDTAIGVDAQGAVGTDADATIARIALAVDPAAPDGLTRLVFRPDVDEIYSTFFSDMNSQAVWPEKADSQLVTIDGTDPEIAIASALQNGRELLVSLGGDIAHQGSVLLRVTASDALAGLAAPPSLSIVDAAAQPMIVVYDGEAPTGTFNYSATVSATTANGLATLTAQATDRAGNSASDADEVLIDKNQIACTVESDTYSTQTYSFDREVVFTATDSSGAVLKTWSPTVRFVNNLGTQSAFGTCTLTEAPAATVRLSAKTDWSLRVRKAVVLDANGQAVASFTGADKLPGGDLDGSNTVALLDYSVLRMNWFPANGAAGDINGDGVVQLLDYSLLRTNWFRAGDPE